MRSGPAEVGDLLPPGAPDSGEYASDNGKFVIADGSGISLVGSPPEYLRVEIAEIGAPPAISHWLFAQVEPEVPLAAGSLLAKAWINVDGKFGDYPDAPAILQGNGSSGVIEL